MGIPVESTLDFNDVLASDPAPPTTGSKLYFYDGNTLKFVSAGQSAKTVQTLDQRARAVWYTSETGTPAPLNSSSPLYAYSQFIVVNDYIIRESDGEVFQWSINPGNGSHYAADLGFSTQTGPGSGNPVTSTIARAWASGSTALGTGFTKIPMTNAEINVGGNYSTATSLYTCPVAGFYQVEATVNLYNASTAQGFEIGLGKNGIPTNNIGDLAFAYSTSLASGASDIRSGSTIIQCAAGDTIGLYGSSTAGGISAEGAGGADWWTTMSVSLIAPLTSAPVTPNTAARAYRNAAQTTLNGGNTLVQLDTVATGNDPGGHMDVATAHGYKVSSAGWYSVSGNVAVGPIGSATNVLVQAQIAVNGTNVAAGTRQGETDVQGFVVVSVADTFHCNVGDIITLTLAANGAYAIYASSNGVYNYLSVVKVDQSLIGGGSGSGLFFYGGTGTPSGITGMTEGSWCIRKSDSEVFEYTNSAWVDQNFTLQGVNGVTPTIARAAANTTTTIGTSWTKIGLATDEEDPGSHFSTATSLYTCPIAGYYRVDAVTNVWNTGSAVTAISTAIGHNGVPSASDESSYLGYDGSVPVDTPVIRSGSTMMKCAAGDTIGLYGLAANGAGVAQAGDYTTSMSVALVAPLTNAPVQPNTAARTYRSASFAMATTGWQKVPVDTVATGSDPGGHLDVTTNHRYNVSTSGWYSVSGSISIVAAAVGTINASSIYYNGVIHSQGGASQQDIAGAGNNYPVSDLIYCSAGDYLELWAYSNAAATLGGGTTQSYLSVVKVDQPLSSGPSSNEVLVAPTAAPKPPMSLRDLGILFSAQGSGYKGQSVEGPRVYWDEKSQRWFMLYVAYSPGTLTTMTGTIALAWSRDFINWTDDAGSPILSPTGVSGDPDSSTVTAPFMYQENGTYYLFYIGCNSPGHEQGTKTMLCATATSLTGPWTRRGTMINSGAASWCSQAIWTPFIVNVDGTYHMFANGQSSADQKERIGHASAPSLLGPWTVDPNPFLDVGPNTWDDRNCADPQLFYMDGLWWMAYSGVTTDSSFNEAVGLAWTTPSAFPGGWTKHTDNPIFSPTSWSGWGGRGCVCIDNGTFYYFYTAEGPISLPASAIGVAVHNYGGSGPWQFPGGTPSGWAYNSIDAAWSQPFQNSWVNSSNGIGTFGPARYRKINGGSRVEMGGALAPPATHTNPIFTVPAAFAPDGPGTWGHGYLAYAFVWGGAAGTGGIAGMSLTSNGNVNLAADVELVSGANVILIDHDWASVA